MPRGGGDEALARSGHGCLPRAGASCPGLGHRAQGWSLMGARVWGASLAQGPGLQHQHSLQLLSQLFCRWTRRAPCIAQTGCSWTAGAQHPLLTHPPPFPPSSAPGDAQEPNCTNGTPTLQNTSPALIPPCTSPVLIHPAFGHQGRLQSQGTFLKVYPGRYFLPQAPVLKLP